MSNTPHELAEEFPNQIEALRKLKSTNAHFAKLAEDYHLANRAVHRAEVGAEPTDEVHETSLRKLRMKLKDKIARMLAAEERTSPE